MIVPLTTEIYRAFTGQSPLYTIQGLASITDGEARMIGCMVFRPDGTCLCLDVKEGFNKRDLIRGWRIVKSWLHEGKNYYAQVDDKLVTSPGLLAHFGFAHAHDDIYVLRG